MMEKTESNRAFIVHVCLRFLPWLCCGTLFILGAVRQFAFDEPADAIAIQIFQTLSEGAAIIMAVIVVLTLPACFLMTFLRRRSMSTIEKICAVICDICNIGAACFFYFLCIILFVLACMCEFGSF